MSDPSQRSIDNWRNRLDGAARDGTGLHDRFVVLTVQEAITAASEGNFGVGAVLVGPDGQVVQAGHNRVFAPRFRSDLHAEMDVLTKFEERLSEETDCRDLTLFSSLEPCPMCLIRLINSGIRKVYHATPDDEGGMVQRFNDLPPEFQRLADGCEFRQASCAGTLPKLALEVFLSTVEACDSKLLERSRRY